MLRDGRVHREGVPASVSLLWGDACIPDVTSGRDSRGDGKEVSRGFLTSSGAVPPGTVSSVLTRTSGRQRSARSNVVAGAAVAGEKDPTAQTPHALLTQ